MAMITNENHAQFATAIRNCMLAHDDAFRAIMDVLRAHNVDPVSGQVLLGWILGAAFGNRDIPLTGPEAELAMAAMTHGWATAVDR